MMDELVFQRETLRREFVTCVEQLQKAADSYDPEDSFPVEDILAMLAVTNGLRQAVADYGEMVAHRIEQGLPSRGRDARR